MAEILSQTQGRATDSARYKSFLLQLFKASNISLGCALTCFALLGATRSIRAGDHNRTNRMFRARIYAQGFTLIAMLAGSAYWQQDREKRKEFDGVIAEKKAKEKNEAWIKELEARDEEEKHIKAVREARRQGLPPPKEKKVDVVQKDIEDGNGATSVVDASEGKKGVFERVQDLVWGKKN